MPESAAEHATGYAEERHRDDARDARGRAHLRNPIGPPSTMLRGNDVGPAHTTR